MRIIIPGTGVALDYIKFALGNGAAATPIAFAVTGWEYWQLLYANFVYVAGALSTAVPAMAITGTDGSIATFTSQNVVAGAGSASVAVGNFSPGTPASITIQGISIPEYVVVGDGTVTFLGVGTTTNDTVGPAFGLIVGKRIGTPPLT